MGMTAPNPDQHTDPPHPDDMALEAKVDADEAEANRIKALAADEHKLDAVTPFVLTMVWAKWHGEPRVHLDYLGAVGVNWKFTPDEARKVGRALIERADTAEAVAAARRELEACEQCGAAPGDCSPACAERSQ